MKLARHLPNAITCCNLIAGCFGIIYVFEGNLELATYMVWSGAFFDFLDGLVARLLKVSSPIGKELDSLADMVTFGVLPGFFMFKLLEGFGSSWSYIGLFIVALSALRLAKFNVDTRQSNYFIGLPTPANTILITALPFLLKIDTFSFLNNPYALSVITVIASLLLTSELPHLSLKVKNLKWENNKFQYLLMICSLTILLLFGVKALSLVVISYILISVIWNLIEKPFVTKKAKGYK